MPKYVDVGDIDLDVEEIFLRDGTRLTEQRAAELGRDIADRAAAARRAGRPSLSGDESRSPHVSVRVPEQTRARLEARAEAEGKRISQVVRDAIDHWV